MLKKVFDLNYLTFDKKVFEQINVIEKGSKSSIANIYLIILEESSWNNTQTNLFKQTLLKNTEIFLKDLFFKVWPQNQCKTRNKIQIEFVKFNLR